MRAMSQPAAPTSRRGSSPRTSIPSQRAIGGTLRAKCFASSSWSPARSDAAHSPASRSSSCSDACSRDRDADERRLERERDERRDGEPVAPAVGLGDDDRHAGRPAAEERALLCPLLDHGGETRRWLPGQFARHCLSPSAVIASFACRSSVLSYVPGDVALPHHVGRDARPLDCRAVLRPLAGRIRAVRVEAVTEHPVADVRQEAVLALPARAVRRVVRVDVDVAAERCRAGCRPASQRSRRPASRRR